MSTEMKSTPAAVHDDVTVSFMVESYTPDATSGVASARQGALAPDEGWASSGRAVRYQGSIAVPEDELVFHLFVASDASVVRELCGRAGIRCDRIVEAVTTWRRPRPTPP